MNQRLAIRAISILVVGGTVLALILGGLYFALDSNGQRRPLGTAKVLAEPGSVPIGGPFSLIDHDGRSVTQNDFDDRFLLVFFGFTYCPDVCPTTLADIARTLDLLGSDASGVQPLFISLDPARDTPERLAEYVSAFHEDIVGLTGSPEQIAAVAKGYRVFYEKVATASHLGDGAATREPEASIDYLISHQGNTYLMSPNSEYLTHFTYGTAPEETAQTIRRTLQSLGPPGT